MEDLTAVFKANGPYAIFEDTDALPRVQLCSRWEADTNDAAILQRLSDPAFNPLKTVLVHGVLPVVTAPVADHPGGQTVDFVRYSPKEIVLQARTDRSAVLLLNDRYDPDWQVTVDGQPATLLRCNYIMRGVQLPPGSHTVRFSFQVPFSLPLARLDVEPDTQAVSFVFHIPTAVPSYLTLAGYGLGVVMILLLLISRRKSRVGP